MDRRNFFQRTLAGAGALLAGWRVFPWAGAAEEAALQEELAGWESLGTSAWYPCGLVDPPELKTPGGILLASELPPLPEPKPRLWLVLYCRFESDDHTDQMVPMQNGLCWSTSIPCGSPVEDVVIFGAELISDFLDSIEEEYQIVREQP